MRIYFLPCAQEVHHFSIVWPSQRLYSKFLLILQFLENFLHDLPQKICVSFPIRYIASSFPFEFDLSIDSPDKVPSSGFGAEHQFHKELHQHFFIFYSLPSNSDCASDNCV